MEYRVIDLINNAFKNTDLEETISYKNKIDENILDVEDVEVDGYYDYYKDTETFAFHLHIYTNIMAPCAITLKPVKVLVDFDTDLFYTFKVVDDDSFEIVGNSINLDEEIWGEIILHMPLRIISGDAEYQDEEEFIMEKESPFSLLNENQEEE